MRLDKFLSETGKSSRSESAGLIRSGKILVNGVPAKKGDVHIDPCKDVVTFCGTVVEYRKFTYILLNKPAGVVSATDDPFEKTVIDLLPDELRKIGLFPCGRLDKYTLGLMILTNDGQGAHRLLSPKYHVAKTYKYICDYPLSDENRSLLEKGIDIGGYVTKPCAINPYENHCEGEITITEGKYHQIKRMFEAINNKINYLERIAFGPITLDNSLQRGYFRLLTDNEINKLFGENI